MLRYALMLILVLLPSSALAGDIALLVADSDSYAVNRAVQNLELPSNIAIQYFTPQDLGSNGTAPQAVAEAGQAGSGQGSPHRHDPSALAWAEPAIEARLQPPYRHLLASAHRVGGPGDG